MRRSLLTVAVTVVAMLMTSVDRSVSGEVVTCPQECRCGVVSGAPSADCSGRHITDLSDVIARLHPDTQVLDVRLNELTVVPANAFSSVRNLSVILLDDNHIHRIERHAFRGMASVHLLSLTGNRITTVVGDSFSELVGRRDVCATRAGDDGDGGQTRGSQTSIDERPDSCVIDLSRNDIRSVERHAFAWIRHLDVILGDGRLPLRVDAYAFYGARGMRQLVFQGVPALTLHPRMFTNTESIDRVVVRNTQMTKLDRFVFEGLKDVGRIVLDRVDVDTVQSFAFSGIQFRPRGPPVPEDVDDRPVNGSIAEVLEEEQGGRKAKRRAARYARSGGLLNVSSCHLGVLSTDAFRDANLAQILFTRTDVDRLEKHAFRGVSGLQTLRLVDCRLESSIGTGVFSSLRGLSQLHLDGLVNTHHVDAFAFRGSTDIDELLVHFRSGNVTLRTDAFAQLSDVGTLELRGSGSTDSQSTSSSSTSSVTSLDIDVGAFRRLFAVRHLRIANFRLPTLRRHAFAGLARVGNLTIADCSVSGIEHEAFGEAAAQVGAIDLLDLEVGNRLHCDCGTTSGVRRELAQRFSDYRAVCRLESEATGRVSYVDIRQVDDSSVCSTAAASRRSVLLASTSLLLTIVTAIALLELVVH